MGELCDMCGGDEWGILETVKERWMTGAKGAGGEGCVICVAVLFLGRRRSVGWPSMPLALPRCGASARLGGPGQGLVTGQTPAGQNSRDPCLGA